MASYAHDVSMLDTGRMLALFGIGAVVMRGAGCTINDMWDVKFDRKVERTRSRPLASSRINRYQALVFLAGQLSCGLAVLTQLNTYSILLGASSMALVVSYPLAKRYTNYPQAVLGATFNWGALLGWPALIGSSNFLVTLPLYASGVLWSLIYDTIYAHQDKADDKMVGIKSTALTFGDSTKNILETLNMAMVSLWLFAAYMNSASYVLYLTSLIAGYDMRKIIMDTDIYDPRSCNKGFVKSQRPGWTLSAGILIDLMLKNMI
jgi:4-hydroxybenzoate polyprenyltransferase